MKRAARRSTAGVVLVLAVQSVCASFFIFDILASVLGLRFTPIDWQLREMLEVGAALGLLLGIVMGGLTLRRTLAERNSAEERLRRAAGAFGDLLEERFAEWGLTPAERDVALFAIKGLSTADIARLRATSEGTVKAQTNAIYRKAGVTGRPQLLSLFIEDLMHDDFAATVAASGGAGPAAVPVIGVKP